MLQAQVVTQPATQQSQIASGLEDGVGAVGGGQYTGVSLEARERMEMVREEQADNPRCNFCGAQLTRLQELGVEDLTIPLLLRLQQGSQPAGWENDWFQFRDATFGIFLQYARSIPAVANIGALTAFCPEETLRECGIIPSAVDDVDYAAVTPVEEE